MIRLLCSIVIFLLTAIPIGACAQERSLFVSVIQYPPVLNSRSEMEKLVTFAHEAHIKILFVQVYRANEAWFPSTVADETPYRQAAEAVAQDPLSLLIRLAHGQGIEVHAWLNLLSLSKNTEAPILKKYGLSILTRNLEPKRTIQDYQIDEQYFLEPGDPRVAADLTTAVEELVRRYPALDGIQFDYIRYPDTKPHYGYTKINTDRFKQVTGRTDIDEESAVWKDWRRQQVTDLLSRLVATARRLNPKLQVSSTGCMPFVRAYYEAYQDWPSWVSSGLVDFVTIMSYAPQPEEFNRTVRAAMGKVPDPSKLKIGVGAYKFVNHPEGFGEEFRSCVSMASGCAVFHYGSLLENKKLKEILTRPK